MTSLANLTYFVRNSSKFIRNWTFSRSDSPLKFIAPFSQYKMPGSLPSENAKLKAVVDVDIDPSGKFKYILCKVFDGEKPNESKFVVRGTSRSEFHSGIFDELKGKLEGTGVSAECLGGGKIEHDPSKKSINVFGVSQGFGKADHKKAVEVLRKKYKDYTSVTCEE